MICDWCGEDVDEVGFIVPPEGKPETLDPEFDEIIVLCAECADLYLKGELA